MIREVRARCRAAAGLILMSVMWIGAPAHAETSGQQLAEAAGRGLVGSRAPRLVLTTIDGQTIDLGALYGKKAVYLKFWATWCVPCREQMPHLERTFEAAGSDLAVIAINIGFDDSLEAIREYRQRLGIKMPIVYDRDGQLGAAFNLRVTPQHIVIGQDGRVQYVGHLADPRLDAALLAARRPGGTAVRADVVEKNPASETPRLGVGDPLPARSAVLLNGQAFQFRKPGLRSPTVLVFLSPWCESYLATTRPSVSESCRRAREQADAVAGERRVRTLGIASGLWATRADLRQYQKDHKVRIPLTLDTSGALFREFAVNDVPTFIVTNADGKIVQRVERLGPQDLRKALDGLM